MTEELDQLVYGLEPITLDRLERSVALQVRTDRKYVVEPEVVRVLDGWLGARARVLEIDGRRVSAYDSVYFDTPAFDSYLGAAHRRPDRFKVRTRRYLDTETCWIEVKQRTRRGQNHKARRTHDPGRPACLTPESREFVSACPRIGWLAVQLAPVVRTRYRRATVVVGTQRITFDDAFVCDDVADRVVGDDVADRVVGDDVADRVVGDDVADRAVGVGRRLIVETKSPGAPGEVDRVLWSLGCRPVKISKFAIGMASFHPALPHNKWHRAHARFVEPVGSRV